MTLADDLRQVRCEALAPPPLLDLAEWADRHARVPVAGNAQPGPWRPFAYQREWMEAFSDPTVKMAVVMKSARIGYTRCLIHAASYYIAQDPSPVLVVLPRESDSEDFSRGEILPALLDTPALFAICGDLRSRSSEQRVAKRVFKNGSSIAFVGANTPNSFRRISARVVLFDECDAYPAEVGDVPRSPDHFGLNANDQAREQDRARVPRKRHAALPYPLPELRAFSDFALV
jgi:phage terminase large subunit GpA-like protein